MPLLQGAMTARRYRVLDPPEPLDRDELCVALAEQAFRQPPPSALGGETVGWVSLHNLCITEFPMLDSWYEPYLCWSLRIDRKRLPPKLLKAMLDLRVREWLEQSQREKIPSAVKAEIKEQLELELFPRQLPSVTSYDVCWDTQKQVIRFFAGGDKVNEIFQALFHRTFGIHTEPIGPVDLVEDHHRAAEWLPRLDAIGHSDYRLEVGR